MKASCLQRQTNATCYTIQAPRLHSTFRLPEKLYYHIEMKLQVSRHVVQVYINSFNIKFYFVINVPRFENVYMCNHSLSQRSYSEGQLCCHRTQGRSR